MRRRRFHLAIAFLGFVTLDGDSFWIHHGYEPFLLPLAGGLLFVALLAALGLQVNRGNDASNVEDAKAWLLLAAAQQLANGLLFWLSTRHYHSMGYRLYPRSTALLFAATAGLFAWLFLRRQKTSDTHIMLVSLISLLAARVLAIVSFPLTALRSDMLPLIGAANQSLTQHVNPYHLYSLPSGDVVLTYLPVTWLAFLPASLLHVDLRFVTLLCELGLLVLLWRSAATSARTPVAVLLALFATSPYLQYRHELYTPVLWLLLIAALVATLRRSLVVGSALMGVGIAASQFCWVVTPFWLLYLHLRYGTRSAMKYAAIAFGCALLPILPFLMWDRSRFLFGILGHWQNDFAAPAANLSVLVVRMAGLRWLGLVQICAFLITLAIAVSRGWCRTRAGMVYASLCGMTVFVLFNRIVWGYFYLLLALLVLLCVMASNEWLAGETDLRRSDEPDPRS